MKKVDANGVKTVVSWVRFNPDTGALYYKGEIYNLNTALKVSQVIRKDDPYGKYQVKITFQNREQNPQAPGSVLFIRFGQSKERMKQFFSHILTFFGLAEESEGRISIPSEDYYCSGTDPEKEDVYAELLEEST